MMDRNQLEWFLSIRRAGILWVVRKGDQRRSFERASLTAEWVNKEAALLEKEKDVPVEKRAADGRVLEKQLYNTSRKTRRKWRKRLKLRLPIYQIAK